MAVIKCSNCENEILDTEIVCPYCDCPVNASKETSNPMSDDDAALRGETVKIATNREVDYEKTNQPRQVGGDWSEVAVSENKPASLDMQETTFIKQNETNTDDESKTEAPISGEAMGETRKYSRTPEMNRGGQRSSKDVPGRKKKKKKKKKESKWLILGTTLVGIVVIIFLVINVFSRIFGEGLFDPEKESKKAKDFVKSSAEELDLGFAFNSHTLTITDETIVSENYEANSEKPWNEHIAETTNLTIANGIEIIGAHAFDDIRGLKHVTLASTVSNIGSSAFYGCSKLEEVVVDSEKSKLKSIGDNAFTDCASLKRVALGKQLKRIGSGAFKSCDSLTRIEIPDTTTEIGEEAFLGCPELVIVCSESSYAYEYAMENGIAVELVEGEESDETLTGNETAPANGNTLAPGVSNSSSSGKKDTTKKNETKNDETEKDDSEKEDKKNDEVKEDEPASSTDKDETSAKPKEPSVPVAGSAPVTQPGNSNQVNPPQGGTNNVPVARPDPSTPSTNQVNPPNVQQQLSDLQTQYKNAQSQAERDRILNEIINVG